MVPRVSEVDESRPIDEWPCYQTISRIRIRRSSEYAGECIMSGRLTSDWTIDDVLADIEPRHIGYCMWNLYLLGNK